MTTIIFKNEKKAKNYEVRAAKAFHIFSKGELIKKIRTDKIELLNENYAPDQITVEEIN